MLLQLQDSKSKLLFPANTFAFKISEFSNLFLYCNLQLGHGHGVKRTWTVRFAKLLLLSKSFNYRALKTTTTFYIYRDTINITIKRNNNIVNPKLLTQTTSLTSGHLEEWYKSNAMPSITHGLDWPQTSRQNLILFRNPNMVCVSVNGIHIWNKTERQQHGGENRKEVDEDAYLLLF